MQATRLLVRGVCVMMLSAMWVAASDDVKAESLGGKMYHWVVMRDGELSNSVHSVDTADKLNRYSEFYITNKQHRRRRKRTLSENEVNRRRPNASTGHDGFVNVGYINAYMSERNNKMADQKDVIDGQNKRPRRATSDAGDATVDRRNVGFTFGQEEVGQDLDNNRYMELRDLDASDNHGRRSEVRDIDYDYIFGNNEDDDLKRRAANPSAEENEDLEMSKELVNVLIKEVYNKLLKTVGPQGVKNTKDKGGNTIKSETATTEKAKKSGKKGDETAPAEEVKTDSEKGGKKGKKVGKKGKKGGKKGKKGGKKGKKGGKKGKKGGKKGKKKPGRIRRSNDLPKDDATQLVQSGIEESIFCHIIKRLIGEKLVPDSAYTELITNKTCFNVTWRRKRSICSYIHCSPVFRSYRSDPISCPNQGYVRRLPSVKYIQNGAVVRNVSIETFRATGGFALSSLRATDVNHNDHRAALQFSFWQPVTIASMRLVQIRPAEKRMVSSVTMEVELAGDKNTWTPLLDARTGHSLVTVIVSPIVHLSRPFTITGLRIYPQSWQSSQQRRSRPVLPYPVFVACYAPPVSVADDVGNNAPTMIPIARYDAWSSMLAAVFTDDSGF